MVLDLLYRLGHRLTHRHEDLTKDGVGRVRICSTRIIGKVRNAYYYPEGDGTEHDVPPERLKALLACVTVGQALRTIGN